MESYLNGYEIKPNKKGDMKCLNVNVEQSVCVRAGVAMASPASAVVTALANAGVATRKRTVVADADVVARLLVKSSGQ